MYGQSPPPQVPNAPSSPTASSEKSIKSCYAVVYELQNRKWAVSGEGGWSEVHLCHDSHDNSHRILAWTVKNQNVYSIFYLFYLFIYLLFSKSLNLQTEI